MSVSNIEMHFALTLVFTVLCWKVGAVDLEKFETFLRICHTGPVSMI